MAVLGHESIKTRPRSKQALEEVLASARKACELLSFFRNALRRGTSRVSQQRDKSWVRKSTSLEVLHSSEPAPRLESPNTPASKSAPSTHTIPPRFICTEFGGQSQRKDGANDICEPPAVSELMIAMPIPSPRVGLVDGERKLNPRNPWHPSRQLRRCFPSPNLQWSLQPSNSSDRWRMI